MPSPISLLLDPISLWLFAIYGVLILWEWLAPARRLPLVPFWKLRGLCGFAVYFFLSSYLPLLWTSQFASWQLLDLSALGTWAGALVGLLVYEAGVYCWHRGMHGSTILWRLFHQTHHSAERIDTYGAFWMSPWDMAGWTVLYSICLTLGIGLTAEAATVTLLGSSFLSVFQHANVRTPRWLGFIVQRPESHSFHHGRGLHAYNYSDLALFDLLLGTLYNPDDFAPEAGFYDGASQRVADMLLMRDVSTPPTTT